MSSSQGGGVAGMSGSSESIITLAECWPEKRGVEGREGKKREKKMDGWAEGPSGDGEGGVIKQRRGRRRHRRRPLNPGDNDNKRPTPVLRDDFPAS